MGRLFSTGLAVLIAALSFRISAADFPTVVATDPNGIDGFELFNYEAPAAFDAPAFRVNGLHWWQGDGRCPGGVEFPHDSTIRVRGTIFGATLNIARSCTNLQGADWNVARDDAYIYFFSQGQLQRKRISPSVSETGPSQPLSTFPFTPTLRPPVLSTPLELVGDYLYWGRYLDFSGRVNFYQMPPDASTEPELIAHIDGGSPVQKLKFFSFVDSGGDWVDALAVLLDNGDFYVCDLIAGTATFVTSSVTDFAIHLRGPAGGYVTPIYLTIGTLTPSPSSSPGRLLKYDPKTAATSVVYDCTGHDQLLSVTTDSDEFIPLGGGSGGLAKNVYITQASAFCDVSTCTFSGSAILRHTLPGASAGWISTATTTSGGRRVLGNLHSDDRYVYFIDGNDIQRISVGATAPEFDIEALKLEVVQAIQTLTNDVPLVANKEGTYVRGYAWLRTNTTGSATSSPSATLRVYVNSIEIAGSPFNPINNAAITASLDWSLLRATRDAAFLFKLPPLPPGSLTMTMNVNDKRALFETGTDPYGNNSVSLSPAMTVSARRSACLVVVPLNTPYGLYSHKSPGFWDIIRRAETKLPVESLKIFARFEEPMDDWFVRGGWFFNDPNDKDKWRMALEAVDWLRSKTKSPCPDTHFVGMIPSNVVWNISGRLGDALRDNDDTPLPVLVLKMGELPTGSGAWNDPQGGRTLAHELGHNYGKRHINQLASSLGCGGAATPCVSDDPGGCPDTGYPFDTCTFGPSDPFAWWGFDPISQQVISPTTSADMMAYAPSTWLSIYHYSAIFNQVPPGPSFADSPAKSAKGANVSLYLLVSGYINPARNTARLVNFYQFNIADADPDRIAESFAASQRAANRPDPFRILLLDASGTVLGDIPLATRLASNPGENFGSFTQYIPYDAQTRRIVLMHGGHVLAQRIVSAHSPTLTLQPPMLDPMSDTMRVSWSASDDDGDALEFSVQYSDDDGVTWTELRMRYPYLSATIGTRQLPGSEHARVRVIASDGVNSAIAMSAPFDFPKHTPEAQINGVVEGQRYGWALHADLHGMVLDAEEGSLLPNTLTWTLAGPTPAFGSGETFSLDDLSPGFYSVTLSGSDAENNVGITSRGFEILPLTIPETTAPLLDGFPNDAAYANAATIRVPLGAGSVAMARMVHAGSNLFVSFSDLQLPAGGARRTIGLRVDADASGDSLAMVGDVGFFVDNNGIPFQEVGTGSGMSENLSPSRGFTAAVQVGSSAWSAELRIADSLLGGWNHSTRIMLAHDTTRWPRTSASNSPASWAPAYLGNTLPPQPSRPPIADAGPARSIDMGETRGITLDGTASHDPDNEALTFTWTQLSGPLVTLSNANSATPSFFAEPISAPTDLRFQLVVSDGNYSSPPVETIVTLLPAQRAPASASTRTIIRDGQFEARLLRTPGEAFAIQASSNLIHWTNIETNIADFFGRLDFMDRDMPLHPMRFYRALSLFPANDDFASPAPLSAATLSAWNFYATKERGEPNHAGNAGGKSLWWSWTTPTNGVATISTIGSDFDTTLGVYVGDSFVQLGLIAADDDGGGNFTSQVMFQALAGVTYRIAVDGYNAANGTIQLNLQFAAAP